MTGTMRRRKANVWELTVEEARGEDGKRRRRSKTVHGTKSEAQRLLRDFVAEAEQRIAEGGYAGPCEITMQEWLRDWFQTVVCRDNAISAQERYDSLIQWHINPQVGQVPLKDLSPRHIEAVQQGMFDKGLSAATVRMARTVLSKACGHALNLEIIQRNPVSRVSPPKVRRREIVPPDVEAVQALLLITEEESHPLFAFLWVLTYTGMRLGEALCLRWENVDLDLGFIRVMETARRSHHHGIVISRPKTERALRNIDLDQSTMQVLHRVREAQEPERRFPSKKDDLVFPASDGGIMKDSTIRNRLKKLGVRVRAPELRFHDLRHFHATVLLQAGLNPVVVSQRLGHASVKTTLDTYAHVISGWQKAAAVAFAKAMERLT